MRALISDLADSLDTAAYLTHLRRDSVGAMNLRDAATLEELTSEYLYNRIILPTKVVGYLPVVEVSGREFRDVGNGREIPASGISGSFRVESGGELLAIYAGDGERGRPEVVLCAAQ